MAKKPLPPPPPGYRYIYRAWRRDPATGALIFAKAFGLKAWPILIPE